MSSEDLIFSHILSFDPLYCCHPKLFHRLLIVITRMKEGYIMEPFYYGLCCQIQWFHPYFIFQLLLPLICKTRSHKNWDLLFLVFVNKYDWSTIFILLTQHGDIFNNSVYFQFFLIVVFHLKDLILLILPSLLSTKLFMDPYKVPHLPSPSLNTHISLFFSFSCLCWLNNIIDRLLCFHYSYDYDSVYWDVNSENR